jgi:outer membrane protein OmpA-like peptidoglycan-associated protein
MVDRTQIREHMDVIASDGERIGRVDEVEGERIKLTKDSSSDGHHHYVGLSDVARIDEHVHLSKTRAALGLAVVGAAAAAGSAASAKGTTTPQNPLPPIRNPAVDGAAPRRNYMLPWVLAGLALLALILALTQCDKDDDRREARTADAAVPAVVTPRVAGAPLRPGTLAYDLDRFMGSEDGLPRTFTFEGVNFDSGTANLRAADSGDLDDIARVLAAYPKSRAAIVGYADARGDSRFNQDLGANRAKAVIAALASRGVTSDRLEARTGGEADPTATNATAGGRFENRRTELVILKR